MITVSRALLGTPNQYGERELCVVISNDGKHSYVLHSDIYILPKYFVSGNINFFVKRPGSKEELTYLQSIRNSFESYFDRVYNIVRISEGYMATVTDEWILSIIKQYREGQIKKVGDWIRLEDVLRAAGRTVDCHYKILGSRSLYDFLKLYCMAQQSSEVSKEKYDILTRTLYCLELYHKIVLQEDDYTLDIDSLSVRHIEDLRTFGTTVGDLAKNNPDEFTAIVNRSDAKFPRKKKYSLWNKNNNQVITWLMMLKKVFRFLRETLRETDNDPFQSYEIGVREVGSSKPFLSYRELQVIRKYPFEEGSRLAQQRDILVFQCLTGMRYRDMIKLTTDNIQDNKIVYSPIPNVKENIPASPVIEIGGEVFDLIDPYEDMDYWGRLFPFVSRSLYEEICREILRECGLTRFVPVHDPKTRSETMKTLDSVFDVSLPIRTYMNRCSSKLEDENEDSQTSTSKIKSNKPSRNISDDVLKAVISLID